MVKHLTPSEQDLVDKVARKKKGSVREALAAVNGERRKRGEEPLTRSPVYRYVTGRTHTRDSEEKRGRAKTLTKRDVKKLLAARRRLIKKENSQHRVTYEDVIEEAGYEDKCSQRTIENALRKTGLRYKAPRKKIALTSKDAKERHRVSKLWAKRPPSFWRERVHCYYDCKAFPAPLTPKQRTLFKQTRVTGHLRFPFEGTDRGFTKPRTAHSWIGAPSVTIAAAVAKDRVIMWHDVGKKWNGATAASVYKGPMLTALRRTWGRRRQYSIVEDGDRKGNQSNKGKNAKREAKLHAIVLPPRTPCWMPLDYSIWQKIVDKLVATSPNGTESKAAFLARLKKAAKTLPRGTVAKAIGRMKKQIVVVKDAMGYHPKSD